MNRLTPDNSDYRLNDADLHRIVNEVPAASEIGWAVKDLLLAHYEIEGLTEENARLRSALKQTEINFESVCAKGEGLLFALEGSEMRLSRAMAALREIYDVVHDWRKVEVDIKELEG